MRVLLVRRVALATRRACDRLFVCELHDTPRVDSSTILGSTAVILIKHLGGSECSISTDAHSDDVTQIDLELAHQRRRRACATQRNRTAKGRGT